MSVRTWRYHLPNENNEGWAIVFLDEIGCFTAVSDYGAYGHRWSEGGWRGFPHLDFRQFLLSAMGDDYILHKIAGKDEYDSEATLAAVKRSILEERRFSQARDSTDFTARRARMEWDLLEDHGDLDFEADFHAWAEATRMDDPWSYHCQGPSSAAKAFVAKVMPRLRAAIAAQLDEESNEARARSA